MSEIRPHSDLTYQAILERTFGKEFIYHGYRRSTDPLSGRRTAIGRQYAGFTARSGAEGAPVNGADFPRSVRAAVRARHRVLAALSRYGRALGRNGIRDVLIGKRKTSGELQHIASNARDVLPLLDMDAINRLRRLPHVDMPGAEAHVFFDPEQDAVYKVTHVFEDGTANAVSPGKIVGLTAEFAPTYSPSYPVVSDAENLVEYAIQQLESSMHDNIVLTELVGITSDGRFLILKQPYIRGVAWGWEERAASMGDQLGLQKIGGAGTPAFLTPLDNRRMLLIVDAHEHNLVYSAPLIKENEELCESTPAFLLDPTARILDDRELNLIKPILGNGSELSFE